MAKDFLAFVRRPADLLKSLRQIAVGGLIAATGSAATPASAAAAEVGPPSSDGASATIVNRARKGAKLVLQLPGSLGFSPAEHRSHRSHSSHRSHYSGSGGGSPAPAPPVRSAPVRPTERSAETVDLAAPMAAGSAALSGEVVAVDTDLRTITIKQGAVRTTFAYRDDSKFQSASGVAVRFDDFAGGNGGRLPLTSGDKIEVQWRTSTDGQTRIISTVQKRP